MKHFESPQPFRFLRILLQILCLGMLLFTALLLVVRWGTIPDKIPTHYGMSGAADAWGGKASLLTTPILAAVLFVALTALERFPQLWNTGVEITPRNRDRVYGLLRLMLVTVKTAAMAALLWPALCGVLQWPLGGWFLPAVLAAMFLPVAGILIAVYRAQK